MSCCHQGLLHVSHISLLKLGLGVIPHKIGVWRHMALECGIGIAEDRNPCTRTDSTGGKRYDKKNKEE